MTYNQLTTEQFIEKALKIHGNKYDYSKVEYVNNHTKVCIICPKHGEFWQSPGRHLTGAGCKKCYSEKQSQEKYSNTQEFVEKARGVHGDKYDYSKVNYVDSKTNVCIICHEKDEEGIEHGEFWQSPNNHLRGGGCQKCYNKRRGKSQRSNTQDFIKKAREIHGDKYDYSKVDYVNCNTKVCIICPKHGEFWQRPDHHLTSKCGCPTCQDKHLEEEIRKLLIENEISFVQEKRFDWLVNTKTNYPQYLDFYLPDYNVAIECQGEQHFFPVEMFGGENEYLKTQQRDFNKFEKCTENNITLFYFCKNKFKKNNNDNIYFSNKNVLIKKIRELK